ncbi:YbgA family protein [Nitrospira sp. Nam80]
MKAALRLGISRCLLGDEVRFDGGHKRDSFLTDLLARYVEWVPVCPEVEAGLGTPREAMRLVGDARHPRLVTIKSGQDQTEALESMITGRIPELEALDLSGYVFKKDSPSCGMERVRLYNRHAMPSRNGVGLFARAFMDRFPLTPIEEEGRLCDPQLRENFIERVFCYRRWQDLMQSGETKHELIRFHTIHKYLLLAHSPQQYEILGRLIGEAARYQAKELAVRYGELFMKALAVKATVRKHVNVLHHMLGYFKARLGRQEKAELLEVMEDYRRGLTPLIVPLTLMKHYVRIFEVEYIRDQVYLNPHPKELMLRNHV